MKLATLVADVILNTSGFTAGVNQAKQNLNTLQKNLTTTQQTAQTTGAILVETIGTGLGTLIADGIQDALGAMWDFAKDSVRYASELETAGRRIDVVFGDNADKLDRWAQTTQDYFGVAEGSAKIYAAQIGTLLSTKDLSPDDIYEMSTALVELAGDLSAFTGFDYDTTMQKLLSGLRGETEAIEDLGLDVRATSLAAFAGLSESDFGKLSNLERIKITYDYIISASEKAQGFFEKNNDTYSAQMAEFNSNIAQLKQTIGEGLLPIVTDLLTFFNDLFGGAETAGEAVGNMSSAFATAYADIDNTAENALKLVNVLERMEKDGVTTDDEFAAWAKTLTELQTLIPSISTLVDEQTMSITGGTSALRAHTEAWKTDGVAMARAQIMQDYYEKVAAQEIKVAQAELAYRAKEAQYQDYIGLESSLEKQAQEHLMKTNPTAYKSWADAYKGFWGGESVDNLLINLDRAGDPTSRALAESLRETRKLRDESFSAEEKEVFEAEKVQLEALRNELKNHEAVMEALTAEDEKNKTPQPKTASEALTELRTYSQQYADQALAGNYEAAQETWSALAALATDEQEAMLREAVTYWQKNGSGQPILPEDFYQYDESGRAVYTDWVTAWEEQIRAEEKRKADEAAVAALMASAGDDEYPDDYVYTGAGEDDTGDSGSTGEFSGTIIVNVYLDGQEIGDIITERVEANIAREAATGSKTN